MNHPSLLMFASLALCACTPSQPSSSPPPPAPSKIAPSHPIAEPPSSQPSSPQEQLDALDPRTPVPLQPMMAWHQKQNMQAHLVAIAKITDALAREDWEGVKEAAERIGSSPSMNQMCEHMGAGAAGFTEIALLFHTRADEIKVAADKQDTSEVLSATAHTLETCTSCHATYRQQVVDASTWQRLVGAPQ